MARSTFYYHQSRLLKQDKYTLLRERISAIYRQHKGRYGYRRITLQLRNEGVRVNHKTVERLMQQMGIKSLVRVKKYRSYQNVEAKSVPNVICRDFSASAPNQKWATDVTEFSICGQKQYLSPVIDLYNGEIISYSLSDSPTLLMVTNMLSKALKRMTKTDEIILHSDQGWHYQHPIYRKILDDMNIIQSMSRKGNCLDNAVIESFFGTFKSELLYLQKFNSINEFNNELENYIYYYNNCRIKEKLNAMSPVNYRTHYNQSIF